MLFKQWLSVALSCAALIASSPLSAQEINMRYSDLYNKLKYNLKEEHDDVALQAFLLNRRGEACNIIKASMRKDEHYEELATSVSGELIIPLDKNLRQANPDITYIVKNDEICDVSFQMTAKNHQQQSISQQEIASLVPQMHSLLTSLSGMFGKWFVPEISGVVVHLEGQNEQQHLILASGKKVESIENKVHIKLVDLSPNEMVKFTDSISKVTPWIATATQN